MVHYNTNKTPLPPWSAAGGTMQASILLDEQLPSFTNLDEISGKVIVRSTKAADVDDIVVKLEGESRTRLVNHLGPNGEKMKPKLEFHKVLYRTTTVFPPPSLAQDRISTPVSGKPSYTLPPGTHEYRFKFKVPFNNSCHEPAPAKSSLSKVGISDWGIEIPVVPTHHVKKTLPPTLGGFPGEAEIRYFVKVTVSRHSFLKENPRAYRPFNFLPIESPRPSPTGSQIYARQRHVFHVSSQAAEVSKKGKMKSMLGIAADATPTVTSFGPANGLAVSVDARLPEPAILTCNQGIPLTILLKRNNYSSEQVFLSSLQIMLRSSTKIKADDMSRTEQSSWIIMSKSNMGMAVSFPSDEEGSEAVIDDDLWRGHILPNTIAPTFETCNISSWYSLDIRVGLAHRGSASAGKQQVPQTIILPLRLDCAIYSGILPPQSVLERMAQARDTLGEAPPYIASNVSDGKLQAEAALSSAVYRPSDDASASQDAPPMPPRPGQGGLHAEEGLADAPPSYFDAVAEGAPPVIAPRPEYAPGIVREEDLRRSEKSGW
nr:hypothetical protein B0A51_03966 [Rachicladosporium sp. CCFEE 5018]